MSFKLSPFFIEIEFLLSRNIREFVEEKQLEIKKKLQFEQMNVEKNRILFSDSFPIINLTISDNYIKILSFVTDNNEVYSNIFDVLEVIGFEENEKLTITNFEKVSHLKFDNTYSRNYFYLYTIEEVGELEDFALDFTEIKDNMKFKYYFRHSDKLNVASVTLESAFIINLNSNNFIKDFVEYEKIMSENLFRITKDKGLPVYSQGGDK